MDENNLDPEKALILLSFCTLTKGKDGNYDLINTVDKLVIMNSTIAFLGLIVMNHLMSYCISNGPPIPKLSPALISAAFYYGPNVIHLSDQLHTVSEFTERLFHDPNVEEDKSLISGKGWVIDNLFKTYKLTSSQPSRGNRYPVPSSAKTFVTMHST